MHLIDVSDVEKAASKCGWLPDSKESPNDYVDAEVYSESYWLKDALRSAMRRDIVDAVNDAEFLAELLRVRLESIMRSTNGD
jgi:hypothetical protein